MIPIPETLGLMQQQKKFFGKLTGFVFNSTDADEKHVTSGLIHSSLLQLHCRVTTFILLCGLLLLSLNEYFGEAITCLQPNSNLPTKLIERYCWFEGNFVYYNANDEKALIDKKHAQAYPGVRGSSSVEEQKFPLKYYQWVYFVLIIQVCCVQNFSKI